MQVFFKTVCIFQRDHRGRAGQGGFIIASCAVPVEMKPFRLPSFGGIIGVRGIAVQQYDLVFAGLVVAVREIDFALSLFHIHNQKAVAGGPFQAVAGKVAEISRDNRIEEQASGLSAGGIDIVIGAGSNALFF